MSSYKKKDFEIGEIVVLDGDFWCGNTDDIAMVVREPNRSHYAHRDCWTIYIFSTKIFEVFEPSNILKLKDLLIRRKMKKRKPKST